MKTRRLPDRASCSKKARIHDVLSHFDFSSLVMTSSRFKSFVFAGSERGVETSGMRIISRENE